MKLIIDGYNLIHSLKLKNTLQQKREKLLLLLLEFKRINNVDILVVFDGSKQESNHRGYENKGGIKIIFSAKGETADDVIIDLIKRKIEKPKNLAVVSSDNKIISFAEKNKLKVILSEEFSEYLL